MRSWVILLLVFPSSLHLASAEVRDVSRRVGIGLPLENHDYRVALRKQSGSSSTEEIVYRPNTKGLSGVQLTIFRLTLVYLAPSKQSETEVNKKGTTSYEDYRGALSLGKDDQFMLLGYYNRYQGFYIENSENVDSSWRGEDPYLRKNDMQTLSAGASIVYILNPDDFSLAAPLFQSAIQKKSGGSILFRVGYDYSAIEGETSLIPEQKQPLYAEDAQLTYAAHTTLSFSLGYGYTLTWNGLYASAAVMFGGGPQWRRFIVDGVTTYETSRAQKSALGFSVGYNVERFFLVATMLNDNTMYPAKTVEINTSLNSTRFVIGMRF